MKQLIGNAACSIGQALDCCQLDYKLPEPVRYIDLAEYSSIMLDKLENIGSGDAGLYLPDNNMPVYRKTDVMECEKLHSVSLLKFSPEKHDCDDFAASMFGAYLGLCWTNVHALNWFIDDELRFWFVEPQSREIAPLLEDWQGYKIRFLIGR
jgi:hypothetical protein